MRPAYSHTGPSATRTASCPCPRLYQARGPRDVTGCRCGPRGIKNGLSGSMPGPGSVGLRPRTAHPTPAEHVHSLVHGRDLSGSSPHSTAACTAGRWSSSQLRTVQCDPWWLEREACVSQLHLPSSTVIAGATCISRPRLGSWIQCGQ